MSSCEFLKNDCFMQLLITTTSITVFNTRHEGVKIEQTFDTILFCWTNVKADVHLEEIQVGS